MEGEDGVTRSVIDERLSSDSERDEMEGERGGTRSIIDEIHSTDIQRDQMERESGVTRSIIDELHSWDIQGDQMEEESMVLLEELLMNFILGIAKDINLKVRAWCYSKYHR